MRLTFGHGGSKYGAGLRKMWKMNKILKFGVFGACFFIFQFSIIFFENRREQNVLEINELREIRNNEEDKEDYKKTKLRKMFQLKREDLINTCERFKRTGTKSVDIVVSQDPVDFYFSIGTFLLI